jgi:hypothetical protein
MVPVWPRFSVASVLSEVAMAQMIMIRINDRNRECYGCEANHRIMLN